MRGGFLADPREIVRSQLSLLVPPELVTTHEVALNQRKLKGLDGQAVDWNLRTAPYAPDIHDALDDPTKRIVAVIGASRTSKTTMGENHLLKRTRYGPAGNFIMYMQSKEDVDDYVDERVDDFYDLHPALKLLLSPKKLGRRRRKVGGYLHSYLQATQGTLRGKAAPFILADEIDGYVKKVRGAILTLVRSRQREFGAQAKAYFCSHPDLGTADGIYPLWWDSDRRIWYWRCLECGCAASPCPEAEWRMTLNIDRPEGMPDDELLDYVAEHASIVCPHCHVAMTNADRLEMNDDGFWVGRGQLLSLTGEVAGDLIKHESAGFWLHGLMSTHEDNHISKIAREVVAAQIKLEKQDGDDPEQSLRETTVKTLGEPYYGVGARAKPRMVEDLKSRNVDQEHALRTVPLGVLYLVATVDVQGDRFEVAVWGFGANGEVWLIDRFPIKAWTETGLTSLSPAARPGDWHVLYSKVLQQVYPLAGDRKLGLPIARMVVDTGGGAPKKQKVAPDGEVSTTTRNARLFGAWLAGTKRVPLWRFMLIKGSPHATSEMIGPARPVNRTEQGKIIDAKMEAALQRLGTTQVFERTVNVDSGKNLAALRLATEMPGANFVHLPREILDPSSGLDYVLAELGSEVYVGGQWQKRTRRNETWDLLVYAILGSMSLEPDRPDMIWEPVAKRPVWARPVLLDKPKANGNSPEQHKSYLDRLTELNRQPS